jgi:hypothetical protein
MWYLSINVFGLPLPLVYYLPVISVQEFLEDKLSEIIFFSYSDESKSYISKFSY